jgi:hypothetical protein
MPKDPRDAKVADMQAQLDKVSADVDDAKHKIAQDTHLGLGDELLGDAEPAGPHDDATPVVPPA